MGSVFTVIAFILALSIFIGIAGILSVVCYLLFKTAAKLFNGCIGCLLSAFILFILIGCIISILFSFSV